MSKKACIIGGETHISEITSWIGKGIDLQAVCVPDRVYEQHFSKFGVQNYADAKTLLSNTSCDVAGIANENDRKYDVIMACMQKGLDVIVDKPLCITLPEQEALEKAAQQYSNDVIMLLTLRGSPPYCAVKQCIEQGLIGDVIHAHLRMAVQLKKEQRPPWFLDVRRSGGLFVDLLIHAIDSLIWSTGLAIDSFVSHTGNIGHPGEPHLMDHAAMYCTLDKKATAVIEGQRSLPGTKGSDYRFMIAGTKGTIDMDLVSARVTVTNEKGADQVVELPEGDSIVRRWMQNDSLIDTADSLHANRLAVLATEFANSDRMVRVDRI